MKVSFSYDFALTFDEAVRSHYYCLRVVPYSNSVQSALQWQVTINDTSTFQCIKDGFGNQLLYGLIGKPHRNLSVKIQGEVELSAYAYHDQEPLAMYQVPSSQTMSHPLMDDLLERLTLPETPFHKAVSLNQMVAQHFTLVDTTKEAGMEKFLLYKKGLSRDFCHLLIALLRRYSIPARLAHGFIEGSMTRTWVEANIGGDWRGFDPITGIVLFDEPYIKLSHGRDWLDCQMYRGSYIGKRQHMLKITGQIGRDEQQQ